MAHCDPDTLALLALGEPAGTAEDAAHLRTCASCREDLDQLRALVSTARAVEDTDQPVEPPSEVWQRVSDSLGLHADGAPSAGGAGGPLPSSPVPARAPVRHPQPRDAVAADAVRARPFWRRPAVLAAAAGLAGLLAGVAGTLAVADRSGGTGQRPADNAPTVLATAALEPLPASSARGAVTLLREDGQRVLAVDVRDLPESPGYYEVWLLDRQVSRLVSLGPLDSRHRGRFPVPEGLDIGQFPVVDVSREPLDGNPAHSSASVVRGALDA